MASYSLSPDDYELKTIIGNGCGNCAKVWLSVHKPTRNTVAVKITNLDSSVDFTQLQKEIHMGRDLRHPNILQPHSVFMYGNEIWQVMPLAAYGSCRDLLQAHFTQGLREEACMYILRDVLQALDYMHQQGIIHRGVRGSHILISANGEVKLTGFRQCLPMLNEGVRFHAVHDFPDNFVQSLLWSSPELLEQNLAGYDTKSDIYSVGITACELANGIVPFSDVPLTQMLLEKIEGITPQLMDFTTVPEMAPDGVSGHSGPSEEMPDGTASGQTPRRFSPQFHEFVALCLHNDPKIRPSASALMQHSFFKQIKRRSSMASLPELLHPVLPITQIPDLPCDAETEDLSTDFESLALEKVSWDFSPDRS